VVEAPVSFGSRLRQLRADAGLTQEELAHAAGVSVRSVSDLERGVNLTARKETARLLADALGLSGPARAAFEVAARGRTTRETKGLSSARMLPRDVAAFTGRGAELAVLVSAATDADGTHLAGGIWTIGGMAGIGKTALAVHAAHLLAARYPDGQIFLPLHGHTPGHDPVEPADAIADLLLAVGMNAADVPAGLRGRVQLWRGRTAGRRMLLVLDDATGHEQVRPLLPGGGESLVLITSRRHLTALDDARALSLPALPSRDAATMLVQLAARPELKLEDVAVAKIAQLCGYLPLAIGMLARQLHHHPAWTAADLAEDLAAARGRLTLIRAEDLSVAAAFDLSYQDLTCGQQRLFRRLGLHPGTDVDAYAAAALDDTDLDAARQHLSSLYDQYLLTEPARGRYQLHDLLRDYARVLAAAHPRDNNGAAVDRLLAYYLWTVRDADRYLARRAPAELRAATANRPAHMPRLSSRDDAVSWMDSERTNLHAAATYAAAHDRLGYATAIPAAMHGFLRTLGHWNQAHTLHQLALDAARRTGDQIAEAGALVDLGNYQLDTGHAAAANASYERALALYRAQDSELGQANALNHLGNAQRASGNLQAAVASHQQALDLHRKLDNRLGEAHAHRFLGSLSQQASDYATAATRYDTALRLFRDIPNPDGEAQVLNNIGQLADATGSPTRAIACYQLAIAIADRIGSLPVKAATCENIGHYHLSAGRTEPGLGYLRQALDIYQKLGSARAEKIKNAISNIQVA
jgi:transcriptional regulator with XRE-family HTH domain/tetratricopeptide (TPR) repeat protein